MEKLKEPFYDDAPVTHVDMSQPYCAEIRRVLIKKAKNIDKSVQDKAVLTCTEGPRCETPAEVKMFQNFGCDVVEMAGFTEDVLARELQM